LQTLIAISAGTHRLHISRCNLCVRLVEWCNPSPVLYVLSSVHCTDTY